jgi:hypothetical protein
VGDKEKANSVVKKAQLAYFCDIRVRRGSSRARQDTTLLEATKATCAVNADGFPLQRPARTSKLYVISATPLIVAATEQYLSCDKVMARSTFLGSRSWPETT